MLSYTDKRYDGKIIHYKFNGQGIIYYEMEIYTLKEKLIIEK